MSATICGIQWLMYLFQDFRVPYFQSAILYCDIGSVIQIANNHVFHELTKHIEIDCHIVHVKVIARLLKLLPISSSMQVADIFTKPLPPNTFILIHSKLGMKNIYSQLEGVDELYVFSLLGCLAACSLKPIFLFTPALYIICLYLA